MEKQEGNTLARCFVLIFFPSAMRIGVSGVFAFYGFWDLTSIFRKNACSPIKPIQKFRKNG
jgi:hypothetical protein